MGSLMPTPLNPLFKLMLSISPIKELSLYASRRLDWRYPGVSDYLAGLSAYSRFTETPWATCADPVKNTKVALVTFAGFFVKGQPPFKESPFGGDFDYRVLHRDIPLMRLAIGREFIDRRLALLDPNILYPVDRLKELQEEGLIGEIAQNHYSFSPYCRDRKSVV